jgi:hypothetical protein
MIFYQEIPVKMPFLNNRIDIDRCKTFLKSHKGLEGLIKKYRPKMQSRKAYLTAYCAFLKEKDKTDLTKYGFREDVVSSPAFGTKKFYKTDLPFNWSELFDYIHG